MCDCCFLTIVASWCCGTGCIIKKGLKDEKKELERKHHSEDTEITVYDTDT